jgi:WD40 repeat protein
MRLLHYDDAGELCATYFYNDTIPPYAILSHTWGVDSEEVTFKDLTDGTGKNKAGWNKIQFCGEQSKRDGIQYFWIDTCCIDKFNSHELSIAIGAMFHWYRDAAKCYVYLSDVPRITSNTNKELSYLPWELSFRESRWFTRGWTLQELIAPTKVEFFSVKGEKIGDKESLEQQIHQITRISVQALRGHRLCDFSVDERLSWTTSRETTRQEDMAYCLLGLFDVHMPHIYGEGGAHAFRRLLNLIDKRKPPRKWEEPTSDALLQTLRAHTDRVNSVAFSSDGTTIGSASWDGTIKIWNVLSGQLRQTLTGHSDNVTAVAFSPMETIAASVSEDTTVKTWEVQSGQERKTLRGHLNRVSAVAFSPDGSIVASASWDRTVKLWDLALEDVRWTLTGHLGRVTAVAFSPIEIVVASASEDATAKLWDASSGQEIQTLKGHLGSVSAVAFSPDNSFVTSASEDATIKLWDLQSGRERQTLSGHYDRIKAIAFSPGGRVLASASWDSTIKLWDVRSAKEFRTIKGHYDYVRSVAFSPDGLIVASGSWDTDIKLWDTRLNGSINGRDRNAGRP